MLKYGSPILIHKILSFVDKQIARGIPEYNLHSFTVLSVSSGTDTDMMMASQQTGVELFYQLMRTSCTLK